MRYAEGIRPFEKNIKKAIYYYQLAVDSGYDSDLRPLGKLYMMPGETADYKLAYRYLSMALECERADYFIGEIEYCFGKLFKDGLGVPQDLEKAYRYFSNALSKGYKDAGDELKHFKKSLFGGWKLV